MLEGKLNMNKWSCFVVFSHDVTTAIMVPQIKPLGILFFLFLCKYVASLVLANNMAGSRLSVKFTYPIFHLVADGKCQNIFSTICALSTNTPSTNGHGRWNSCKLAGTDSKCISVVLRLLSFPRWQLSSCCLYRQCWRVNWILCDLSWATTETWRQATKDCSPHKSTYQIMGILSRCHGNVTGAMATGDN